MKAIILFVAMLLCFCNLKAQDLEATSLPSTGLDSSFYVQDVNRTDRSTLMGYNWISVDDSMIGRRLHANVWHLDDPFLDTNWYNQFRRNMLPKMRLIVNIDSVGILRHSQGNTDKRTIPLQAFAIEYQPWLGHGYNAVHTEPGNVRTVGSNCVPGQRWYATATGVTGGCCSGHVYGTGRIS